ncbi:MAG: DUF1800 family protein [Verrucomicrobia bacterium]|nr:DUF1800 family protein [Verrucomicrobiota bacterium]
MRKFFLFLGISSCLGSLIVVAQPGPGDVTDTTFVSNRFQVTVKTYPNADGVTMRVTTNLASGYTNSSVSFTGSVAGYVWTLSNSAGLGSSFLKPQIAPIPSNTLLTATILNRLAYGPTPDDLDRILGFNGVTNTNGTLPTVVGIGPQAWIDEQLDPTHPSAWLLESSTNIALWSSNANTNVGNFASRFAEAADYVRTNEVTGPGSMGLRELQGWHILQGVYSRHQLLEQLAQFFENYFITQWSKEDNFFNGFYNGVPNVQDRQAARLEWMETRRYREALTNSGVTFSNVFTIQAESPAMIIYLDTQTSRGDGANIANENYAREIMELFSVGVDNGYDQNDITALSPAWTGWNCRFVNPPPSTDFSNVFAWDNSAIGATSNKLGVWAFNYRNDTHGNGAKFGFYNRSNANGGVIPGIAGLKTVPARFGPPWTTNRYGTNTVAGAYALYLPVRDGVANPHPGNPTTPTANGGKAGIQDGYDVVKHLANLPFTEEFTCYKLCRWFVHDSFGFGPVNGFDFRDNPSPPLTNSAGALFPWYSNSAEGILLKQCMMAWETNSPKGQLYPVLRTIFSSDLFRNNALRQKVKTPLEYTVSGIRALRANTNGALGAVSHGIFSANTDGVSVAGGASSGTGSVPVMRMGNMSLYDRDTPNGYPEDAYGWISAGTLAERIRWIQTALMASGDAAKNDLISGNNNTFTDPLGFVKKRLNDASQQNVLAIANLFVDNLFLGEGKQNLDLYRTAAVNFLNSNASGAQDAYGPRADYGSESHDERLRGMIAMLMSLPRFQEQ